MSSLGLVSAMVLEAVFLGKYKEVDPETHIGLTAYIPSYISIRSLANPMILDQKMPKCETVPIILLLGAQKLLKCETVPIILFSGLQKLLKCETVPIILLLGMQKLLKCETVSIILLLGCKNC